MAVQSNELVCVITDSGRINQLSVMFNKGGTPFQFMAVGKGLTAPDKESISLNQECGPSDGEYSRVAIETTIYPDKFMAKSVGIFPVDNITESTTITEIGLVNTDVIGTGDFWCICQVEPTEKDSAKRVQFTVYSTMNACSIA